MSAGRNIAVYPKDLVQYYLAEYSDSSVYLLYVKSYLYDTSASSANALDYQIKFYNDPLINYCDVRIIRKGSNVSFSDFAPGYYSSVLVSPPRRASDYGDEHIVMDSYANGHVSPLI